MPRTERGDGEKAPPRGLSQTRSAQPQPAYDADALKQAARSSTADYADFTDRKNLNSGLDNSPAF